MMVSKVSIHMVTELRLKMPWYYESYERSF